MIGGRAALTERARRSACERVGRDGQTVESIRFEPVAGGTRSCGRSRSTAPRRSTSPTGGFREHSSREARATPREHLVDLSGLKPLEAVCATLVQQQATFRHGRSALQAYVPRPEMAGAMAELPDIYLIGAPKAGTTSITRWLESHPDIYFCRPKEPFYWSTDYPRMREHRGFATRRAYESLYESREAQAAAHRADGSTTYLYSRTAVPSILEEVPGAHFVVALRNPIDLLASWHRTQLLALNEDEPDFAAAWRRSLKGGSPRTDALDFKRVDYALIGCLGQAVQRLLKVAPRDSVHFVVFDDLTTQPAAVWVELTTFLDIPNEPTPSFKAHNPSTKMYRSPLLHRLKHRPPALLAGPIRKMRQRSLSTSNPLWSRVRRTMWRNEERPVVDEPMRRELGDFFAEDIALLGKLLGRDFSAWSSPR